ncbi:hypothetical protein CHL67_03335 [Prosthecochloris sp. GSB1]|nr:hypothetical protein CHL67_03335 [Prosthecochloris sp. GSB1]
MKAILLHARPIRFFTRPATGVPVFKKKASKHTNRNPAEAGKAPLFFRLCKPDGIPKKIISLPCFSQARH